MSQGAHADDDAPPTPPRSIPKLLLGDDTKMYNYSTLDDVPDFALEGPHRLYALMLSQFEGFEGVALYGPQTIGFPTKGYWGRHMTLKSQEIMQMRFAPKDIASNPTHEFALVATRIVSMTGVAQVNVAVLFRSDVHANGCLDVLAMQPRTVGCKGLHVLMASFFKRHHPTIGANRTVMSHQFCSFDPYGYQSIRSTTYSVHMTDRKNLEKSADHANAWTAAPGSSVLTIAAELVNVDLTRTMGRPAEPIAKHKWTDMTSYMHQTVMQERGETRGSTAIRSAAAIVELLSAEGFVGMRSNGFFDGALPDRLAGPHGPALSIAMGIRMATYWTEYGLPRPSACDMMANDQLRMIFETGTHAPLPCMGDRRMWCIDVVIRGALAGCNAEMEELKKARNMAPGTVLHVLEDNKVFWQRACQRLTTSLFGLGSNSGVRANDNRFGSPWRVRDPLQEARDEHLAAAGFTYEGLDLPMISLAPVRTRRASLVQMLNDVETWLRTGLFGEAALSPSNDEGLPEAQREHTREVLSELMMGSMLEDLGRRVKNGSAGTDAAQRTYDTYEEELGSKLRGNFNMAAMAVAMADCKGVLLHGPSLHFQYSCGAYVVAPTQTSPCTDCEQQVHVLQGVLLANSYSHCTACHAKRCLACAEAYARQVRVTKPQKVGKRCRSCGADAAFIDIKTTVDKRGVETHVVHMGERVSTRPKGRLEGEAINDTAAAHTGPPTRKGKSSKR